ncbi:hypothetical protein [Streptomyces sp. NRRL S-87]|uniref:hypothetical protein n=1 Tax=Streptomyces sp. NRRL S-87 TaxID=1463920 RepID=UPI0004C08583|nr:hypothetical protein [Streptomyces sp. NRRL S-87]
MLSLRLARGGRPLVQLRRLLVAAAAAGTGLLLLDVLATAAARPQGQLPRLLWCAVPLALTVQFAVAVTRTDPAVRPREDLDAVGLGPVRLIRVAALSAAIACALGSALALALFLHLRGDLAGLPFDGAAADALRAGHPFPVAAALTLLALAPLAAAAATALSVRTRPARTPHEGLPWGVAAFACGLAVLAYAGGGTAGRLSGWALTTVGLALAGPALAHGCGALLQFVRPGAVRLLAGRGLQEEAGRIGRPLGVLVAVAAWAVAAADGGPVPVGPTAGGAAALAVLCAVGALLTAAVESRQTRAATRETLLDLGTPAAVLRSAALLRAAVLPAVCGPVVWGVAELTRRALAG